LAVYRPNPTEGPRNLRPESPRHDPSTNPRLHINGKPVETAPAVRTIPGARPVPSTERPTPRPTPMRPADAIANPAPGREIRPVRPEPLRPEFPRPQPPFASVPGGPIPENGPARPSPERRIDRAQPVVPPQTPAEALPRRSPPVAEAPQHPRFTPMHPPTRLHGQSPSRNPGDAGRLQRPGSEAAPSGQRPQVIQQPQPAVPQTAAPRFAPPATTPPPRTAPPTVHPRFQSKPSPAAPNPGQSPVMQRPGQRASPTRNGQPSDG
jgi:hypothetical protein